MSRYTVTYGGFTLLETDDYEHAYEVYRLNGPYTRIWREEETTQEAEE